MKTLLLTLLLADSLGPTLEASSESGCDICFTANRNRNRAAFLSDNCQEDGDIVKILLNPASANAKGIDRMTLLNIYSTDYSVGIHFAGDEIVQFSLEALTLGEGGHINTAHTYFPGGRACKNKAKKLVNQKSWWMYHVGNTTFPLRLCMAQDLAACETRLGCDDLAGAIGWGTMGLQHKCHGLDIQD